MTEERDRLKEARERIDSLDRELVALLQERARQALAAARGKRERGLPILDEQREREILARLSPSTGPLDPRALARIFQAVMDEMRRTEEQEP